MSDNALNRSMNSAVKHYESLFKLPSYGRVFLFQTAVCLGCGFLAASILSVHDYWLTLGLSLSLVILLVNVFSDLVISRVIMKGDPIFDFRRTAAVSLICLGFWAIFLLVGTVLAVAVDSQWWWIRLCLFGFSAVLILRLVVFRAVSSLHSFRSYSASFLQPVLHLILFLTFWAKIGFEINLQMLTFIGFSTVLGLVASLVFLSLLDRVGKETVGVPALSLLKAFLLNWILGLNAPFEELLEKLGEETDVEVSLIRFGYPRSKAAMVVPFVHPGPFKNIGSSALPYMIKTELEAEIGCVVAVPHGLFGHELDLASQAQNKKLIKTLISSADCETFEAKASPLVSLSNGLATASCQIFGNSAFLSFTLSPRTTEDFPKELGIFARQEAEKYGLACSAVVNAHNSIDGPLELRETLDAIQKVAAQVIKKAVSLNREPFSVGGATVFPKEFGLKDGMGMGGITAIVVKAVEQKAAYIIIDGNNMIAGLRERMLSALRSIGVDEGEIFTTDTHVVNAVILGERGYHPVGEVTDNEKLVGYVKEATINAISCLEPVENVCCRSVLIRGVKVIGEKQLEMLCLLIDKGLKKAKRIFAPIFGVTGLFLMLLLLYV
ncbi:MAG: DUF2070 family protein [Candidatus Bathyarchaeota archaeon]|nr:DUF2070 family protein [Candidatus Bathyarchaeota archaeon]